MGNRAVIQFGESPDAVGIYLHWNGGQESVEAFLRCARDLQVRADDYGVARLCQIIGNWFGGGLSLGCGPVANLYTNNGDNGTYIVENWQVTKRVHCGRTRKLTAGELSASQAIYDQCMAINAPIFAEKLGTHVVVARVPDDGV
jgi:hypothetical protein